MLDADIRGRNGGFTLNAQLRSEAGITILFGRSGAGKSTFIDMIAGLRKPDVGVVRVNGQVMFDGSAGIDIAPERRHVGYVFQDARLFPHYSVRGNLEYGLRRRGAEARHFSFDDIVALLELEALLTRRPATLSGGEGQRVAIGRALLSQPSLLLLDEPLSSLDVTSREQLIPFIARIGKDLAMPVIYVSHNIEEVVRLGDVMALMSAGRIIETGTVENIMSRLDLRPLTGRHEAGAVMTATVEGHDAAYGLTILKFADGKRILAPRVDLASGEETRIRIRARDVALALSEPSDSSVLNIFPGTVIESAPSGSEAQVEVSVDIGVPLSARITRKSMEKLDLRPGKQVYAMIKSVAVDRRSVGAPLESAAEAKR